MLSAAGAGEADEMGMAILQHMLARHAGLIANELVVVKNNFHAYDRHIPILEKIVQNPEYPAPVFWLNPEKTDFYSFTVDDFKLIDYKNTKLEEKIPVAV
jgi:thymidylate synthase